MSATYESTASQNDTSEESWEALDDAATLFGLTVTETESPAPPDLSLAGYQAAIPEGKLVTEAETAPPQVAGPAPLVIPMREAQPILPLTTTDDETYDPLDEDDDALLAQAAAMVKKSVIQEEAPLEDQIKSAKAALKGAMTRQDEDDIFLWSDRLRSLSGKKKAMTTMDALVADLFRLTILRDQAEGADPAIEAALARANERQDAIKSQMETLKQQIAAILIEKKDLTLKRKEQAKDNPAAKAANEVLGKAKASLIKHAREHGLEVPQRVKAITVTGAAPVGTPSEDGAKGEKNWGKDLFALALTLDGPDGLPLVPREEAQALTLAEFSDRVRLCPEMAEALDSKRLRRLESRLTSHADRLLGDGQGKKGAARDNGYYPIPLDSADGTPEGEHYYFVKKS